MANFVSIKTLILQNRARYKDQKESILTLN